MQTQSQLKDELLQLSNNIFSLLNMPIFLNLSSISTLFNSKMYFDILSHLHPILEQHLQHLQNTNNSNEKRWKALIDVLDKIIGGEGRLKGIKGKKIGEKNVKMTMKLMEVMYGYVKSRINKKKREEEEAENSQMLLSQEDSDDLYERVVGKVVDHGLAQVQQKKKKKKKRTLRKVKSLNKLSISDCPISKQIQTGIKRMRSAKPKNYLTDQLLNTQISRKTLQLNLKQKQISHLEQKNNILLARSQHLHQINELKKQKSQNQKQQHLKESMRRQEKSLEYKMRDQKTTFLRKMQEQQQFRNSAVMKLEKERLVEQAKRVRDSKREQNKQLEMEIESIKSYYKSQMDLTREGEEKERRDRALVERAYKQVASRLEKEMKDENMEKMKMISLRSEGELLRWQDMERVEQSVRQIYKKYY